MRMNHKYSGCSDNDSGLSMEKEVLSSFSSNHSNTQHQGITSNSKHYVFLKIFIVDIGKHLKYEFSLNNSVFDVKRALLRRYGVRLVDPVNYGLFIPHEVNKSGKFLREERLLSEYMSPNSIKRLEFIYKSRISWPDKSNGESKKKINSKVNQSRFVDYIIRNDTEKINKALQKGLDPNFHCSSGETPLTLTAKLSKPTDVITALVQGGAHLDYRSTDCLTPVHKAAIAGNYDTLATLLDFGASANCVDGIGMTPLYYNLLNDSSTKCLEKLLYEHGKLGVVDKKGLKEIHQTCRTGKPQHLDLLLAYGADVNSRTENHLSTPLHVAAYTGQEDCVRLLLVRGADRYLVNSGGRSAMQEARATSYRNIAGLIRDFKDSEIHTSSTIKPTRNPKRKESEFDVTSCRMRIISPDTSSQYSEDTNPYSKSTLDRRSRRKCGAASTTTNIQASTPAIMNTSALKNKNKASGGNYNSMRLKERCSSQGAIITKSLSYNIFSDHDDTSASSDLRSQTNSNREYSSNKRVHRNDNWRHSSMMSLDSQSWSDSEINMSCEIVLTKSYGEDYGIDLDDAAPNSPSLYVIKNVVVGSPAFLGGIRCDDFLLEVNGTDVHNAPIDKVKHLFNMRQDTVVLRVLHSTNPNSQSSHSSSYNSNHGNDNSRPIYEQFAYNDSNKASNQHRRCYSNRKDQQNRYQANYQCYEDVDDIGITENRSMRNSMRHALSVDNLTQISTITQIDPNEHYQNKSNRNRQKLFNENSCYRDSSTDSSSFTTSTSSTSSSSRHNNKKHRSKSKTPAIKSKHNNINSHLNNEENGLKLQCGESSTTLNSVCTLVASQDGVEDDNKKGGGGYSYHYNQDNSSTNSSNSNYCYTLDYHQHRKRSQSIDKRYQKNAFPKTESKVRYRTPLTTNYDSLKPILKNSSQNTSRREDPYTTESLSSFSKQKQRPSIIHQTSLRGSQDDSLPNYQGYSVTQQHTAPNIPPRLHSSLHTKIKAPSHSQYHNNNRGLDSQHQSILKPWQQPIKADYEPPLSVLQNINNNNTVNSNNYSKLRGSSSTRDSQNSQQTKLSMNSSEDDLCLPPPVSFQ